jgi:tRNA pseudouridine55 synthase
LDELLQPTENALPEWPQIHVSEQSSIALRHGQSISCDSSYESANVRLFDHNKSFMGLGEMTEDGRIAPKRIFVLPERL